jgi:hypothetical protein
MLSFAHTTFAFCRATTCAQKNPSAECLASIDPNDESQCYHAGAPLFWEQPCVSFSVAEGGSPKLGLDFVQAESLISVAFAQWVNTECPGGFPSIAVQSMGRLQCDQREYNPKGPNANSVLFRDDDWPYDAQAIGLTTVNFNPTTGKILNADMEINSFGFALNETSLSYVVTHEAGHFFGLSHSSDQAAILFASYTIDESRLPTLAADDINAICAAYPSDRVTLGTCDFEPELGYASDCGGDVEGGCHVAPHALARDWPRAASAFLILAGAALLRRRRLHRPRRS